MSGGAKLGLITAGVLAGECVGLAAGRAGVWAATLGGAATIVLGFRVWRGAPHGGRLLALAGGALAVGALRAASVVAPALPACHVAHLPLPMRAPVVGRVVAAPERHGTRTRLVVDIDRVGGRRACGRVRLSVRNASPAWSYGARFRIATTLRRPRNFRNPGSYDLVGHLARQGIHVAAFLWDDHGARLRASRDTGWRARLERWRERVGARIARVSSPEGAVLRALVLGDEGSIGDDLRTAFARAGVVHILSVSGLHIGLVAAGAFVVVRWLLARSEIVLLAVDVRRVAAAASIPPVLLYAVLAGAQVATLRSVVMCIVAAVGVLVGRRVDVGRSLCLAALVLALLWPGAPLEIGFQLSFASVLAIVVGMRRGDRRPDGGDPWWRRLVRRVWQAVCVSAWAAAGTTPLTAFHFHQVSLVAVLVNPVVVPLFGSAVVGLGLTGALVEPFAPTGAEWALRVAGWLLRPGVAAVGWVGEWAWAAIDTPLPSLWELALGYGVLAGVVLRPRAIGRWLAAVACVGLVLDGACWIRARRGGGELRVTFLDVGQGDAAVVEFPDGRVVGIDAGGMPGGDFDTGAAVVGPFLWSRKIRRLDAVAVTHAHPDHFGGVPYLLEHFTPGALWWPGPTGRGEAWERLVAQVGERGVPTRTLRRGLRFDHGGATITVLNPGANGEGVSVNDTSLALEVAFGTIRLLLTGDIEAPSEQRMLDDTRLRAAAILKAPHHGSRTSSTTPFVARVAPQVVVVSVGAGNRYGLPSPEVEARYRAVGACVLRTDRCGAVTARTDGKRLRVAAYEPGCTCPTTGVVTRPG